MLFHHMAGCFGILPATGVVRHVQTVKRRLQVAAGGHAVLEVMSPSVPNVVRSRLVTDAMVTHANIGAALRYISALFAEGRYPDKS